MRKLLLLLVLGGSLNIALAGREAEKKHDGDVLSEKDRAKEVLLSDEQALKLFCSNPHRAICDSGEGKAGRDRRKKESDDWYWDIRTKVQTKIIDRYCKEKGILLSVEELYDSGEVDPPRRPGLGGPGPTIGATFENPLSGGSDKEKPLAKKNCEGAKEKSELVKGEPYREFIIEIYSQVLKEVDLPKDELNNIREVVCNGLLNTNEGLGRSDPFLIRLCDKEKMTYVVSGEKLLELADPDRKVGGKPAPNSPALIKNFRGTCRENGGAVNAAYSSRLNSIVICPGLLVHFANRKTKKIGRGSFGFVLGHETGHAADSGEQSDLYRKYFACLAKHFSKFGKNTPTDIREFEFHYGREISADYWGARTLVSMASQITGRTNLLGFFRESLDNLCNSEGDKMGADAGFEEQTIDNFMLHPSGPLRITLAVQPFQQVMGCKPTREKPSCDLRGEVTE